MGVLLVFLYLRNLHWLHRVDGSGGGKVLDCNKGCSPRYSDSRLYTEPCRTLAGRISSLSAPQLSCCYPFLRKTTTKCKMSVGATKSKCQG